MGTIAVIGTLDTKGEEFRFLKEQIKAFGCVPLVIDCGIVGEPGFTPDISNKLVAQKYSTYEWNVGYSPKSQNSFEFRFSFGTLRADFDLEQGMMKNVKITGDFFSERPVAELQARLENVRFQHADFKKAISCLSDYIVKGDGNEVADKVFGV